MPFTVKALIKVGLNAKQRQFQLREIQLHHAVRNHPTVVSLIGIIESDDCIFLVLEYCPEGDLLINITEYGRYLIKEMIT